jgi:hypothetical protein
LKSLILVFLLYRVPRGDDALFQLLDGSGRVAFVHLHWGKAPGRIDDKFRTSTRIYMNFEAFRQQHMLPEHEEWMTDHPED